jgi:pyruvate dehydrogenase E1 component alpha subunit
VVFVFENNGYAETTASSWSVACGDIVNRAPAFGMPGVKIDGFDFFAVHEAAGKAIARARAGEGPSLLEVSLGRFYGHHEGDTQSYRAKDEAERLRSERDCLSLFRGRVLDAGLLSHADFDKLDAEIDRQVDEAVAKSLEAPPPGPEALFEDVYVSY